MNTYDKLFRQNIAFSLMVMCYCWGGFAQNYDGYIGTSNDPTIVGSSIPIPDPFTRNINSIHGQNFQDIKRSVALFIPDQGILGVNNKSACSAVFINNVEQLKNYYLITSSTCMPGIKQGEKKTAFLSFDFELPHGTNNGTRGADSEISKVYKVEYEVMVLQEEIDDNVLIKITNTFGNFPFHNTYASGWDNSLKNIDYVNFSDKFFSINHPRGDHKKIYDNADVANRNIVLVPQSRVYDEFRAFEKADENIARNLPQGFQLIDLFERAQAAQNLGKFSYLMKSGSTSTTQPYGLYNWNGEYTSFWSESRITDILKNNLTGAIGSGFYNGDKLLKGIVQSDRRFAHIINSFYPYSSTNITKQNYMRPYLDPKISYINTVPGGYYSDLIPNSTEENLYSHTLNPGQVWSTPGILEGTTVDELLGPDQFEQNVIYVDPRWIFTTPGITPESELLKSYGIIIEDDIGDATLVLKMKKLTYFEETEIISETDLITITLDNSNFDVGGEIFGFAGEVTYNDSSIPKSVRGNMLNAFYQEFLNGNAGPDPEIVTVGEAGRNINFNVLLPVVIELKNTGSKPVNVLAVNLPSLGPRNVKQLFNLGLSSSLFESSPYYAPSVFTSRERLNINSIRLVQKSGPTRILPQDYSKQIITGDNGGYVDLDNFTNKIGPLFTHPTGLQPVNDITMQLELNLPEVATTVSYKLWISHQSKIFEPITDAAGNEIEGTVNNLSSNNNTIELKFKLNPKEHYGLANDESKFARLRVQMRRGTVIPSSNDISTDAIPINGEVEDYLLDIKAPAALAENFVNFPKISVNFSGITRIIDNIKFTRFSDYTELEHEIVTQEEEYVQREFDDFLNTSKVTKIGSSSYFFNGSTYFELKGALDGSTGEDFIYNPFDSHTSAYYLVPDLNCQTLNGETICTTKPNSLGDKYQIIYEEGGVSNGLSLRMNNTNIQFGVKINGVLDYIDYPKLLEAGTYMVLTTVFDQGELLLYIDGQLVDSKMHSSGLIEVQARLDTPGLGGVAGNGSIWPDDTVNTNFVGVMDYFGYTNTVLSASTIADLADGLGESELNLQDFSCNEVSTKATLKVDQRVGKLNVDKPIDSDSDEDNINAIELNSYPFDSPQNGGMAVVGQIADSGLAPLGINLVLAPYQEAINPNYINPSNFTSFGGGGGATPPDSDCLDPDFEDSGDLGFDPDNEAAWAYWAEFNSLYNNLSRILRLYKFYIKANPYSDVPVVFDGTEDADLALYVQFVHYFNTVVGFRETLIQAKNEHDFLRLIYEYDQNIDSTFLESVFPPEDVALFRNLYGFFLQYKCYVQQVVDLVNSNSFTFNLNNNPVKVALDWFGDIIPNQFSQRTIYNFVSVTQYPNPGELAVIYKAKGDNNQTIVGINSSGNIVYTVIVGGVTYNLVSSQVLLLDKQNKIITRFDNGEMALFINSTPQGTTMLSSNMLSYTNFTEVGNGARWGGTLTVNNAVGSEVPFHGKLIGFMLFEEALTLDEIEDLNACIASSADPQEIPKQGNTEETPLWITSPDLGETSPPDFSLFPNPATNMLNLIVEVRQEGPLKIELFDLNGKRVYLMEDDSIGKGHQYITLNNINVAAGQYILRIQAGDFKANKNVIFK